MSALLIIIGVILWGALIGLAHALRSAPREGEDWGLAWVVACVYVRLWHRVRYEGLENIPRWKRGEAPVGPLIIVCNHTAGVDPLLLHGACPFDIRWMMMREMMLAPFERFWRWIEIIPVEQNGRDSTSLRTAIRHLQSGGVIGIFAEGGLERPHGCVNPFLPGVGLLVLKGKARVLPVVIWGTPRVESAYASLLIPSRACVRFLPVREYAGTSLGAAEIALSLEEQAAGALGWARCAKEPAVRGKK